MNERIVFIDGYCVLCNRFANFIIKKDKHKNLKLSTLQGIAFKKIESNLPRPLPDSVVLMDGNLFYHKSDAVIRIMRLLPFPYNLSIVFLLIPRSWRDYLYDRMAARRFRIFGKRDVCRIPEPGEMDRFID